MAAHDETQSSRDKPDIRYSLGATGRRRPDELYPVRSRRAMDRQATRRNQRGVRETRVLTKQQASRRKDRVPRNPAG